MSERSDPVRLAPDATDEKLTLILEGIEQLAHRMADVVAHCDALAESVERLAGRMGELERRLDEEMLRRVERELGGAGGVTS